MDIIRKQNGAEVLYDEPLPSIGIRGSQLDNRHNHNQMSIAGSHIITGSNNYNP